MWIRLWSQWSRYTILSELKHRQPPQPKTPCFVIHRNAYFPTGLFYLLPGPCLPCSKFDVSGYQFIPTWNKEKWMVRDKQQHIHKHNQNMTLKHMSCMYMRPTFSCTYSAFTLQTIHQYFVLFNSISLPSPVYVLPSAHRGYLGFPMKTWNCRQVEWQHYGRWPGWSWDRDICPKGWPRSSLSLFIFQLHRVVFATQAYLGLVKTTYHSTQSTDQPDSTVLCWHFLQLLQGGEQNLLLWSILPHPLTEITVSPCCKLHP